MSDSNSLLPEIVSPREVAGGQPRVATHRSDMLDWQNSHALEGEIIDAIRALKHQAGVNLLTWGSKSMVRQMLAAGLVDEFRLLIYPVVLGCGKRLFGDTA